MATLVAVCSECSAKVRVSPEALGKNVRCPVCQGVFAAVPLVEVVAETPTGSQQVSRQPLPVAARASEPKKTRPVLPQPAPAKISLLVIIGLPVFGLLIAAAIVLGLVVGGNWTEPDKKIEKIAFKPWDKKDDWREGGKQKFFILPEIDKGGLNKLPARAPLEAGDAV